MGQDLIVEIGTEEIPAGFLMPALAQLKTETDKLLGQERISYGSVITQGTPRRMVLMVDGVAASQEDAQQERTGPFVAQAFDDSGAPTKAAQGFARGCGVAVEDLGRVQTPKGEKLAFVKKIVGRSSLEVFSEILPGLISGLNFPKSMRWGTGETRFGRPSHWIAAMLGDELIKFNLTGIESGNQSRGHRFTHPDVFSFNNAADYLEKIAAGDVVLDPQKRRDLISERLGELAGQLGGEVIDDPELLDEVVNLVEVPVVVSGEFDESFLELPAAVLIESMRSHQRYFALKQPGSDKLLPSFIAVCNNTAADPAVMAKGNSRVLGARLADAQFFFTEDSKLPLEHFTEELSGMVFQEKLGSYADKASRLKKLAGTIAGLLSDDPGVKADSERAAWLCKADLVSLMVGEFPELQGMIGGAYALKSGEPETVALAIRDHYLPGSAQDIEKGNFPCSVSADAVSLADKLDSLVGCWGVGLAPSGSADPYALRRLTLGILNIIRNKGYRLCLPELVKSALEALDERIEPHAEEVQTEVLEYIAGRIKNMLMDESVPYDAIDAGLSVWNGLLVDTIAKIDAVSGLKQREDFEPLMIAFKRVVNIIEGEPGPVDSAMLQHESEQFLYSEFSKTRDQVRPLVESGDYQEALSVMAGLRLSVDKFFDDVMVNVDDAALRANRHALLNEIAGMFKQVADFGKIVIEGNS